jgi:hypothetical protein
MLSFKTFGFWKTVSKAYRADYIVKIDDDNYVRLDRLAVAIRQWKYMGAGTKLFSQYGLPPSIVIPVYPNPANTSRLQ